MEEWGFEASVRIKRAMRKRDWGYKELSEALKGLGVKRNPTAINRRINRGNFSAGLFLACLYVLEDGADEVSGAKPIVGADQASNEPSQRRE